MQFNENCGPLWLKTKLSTKEKLQIIYKRKAARLITKTRC